MIGQLKLTRRERDCILAIKESSSEFPIRLSQLAQKIELKPPTVIEILRRLEAKGLLKRESGMIVLTNLGMSYYNYLVNCHRILETIFVDSGIDIEKACKEVSSFDFMLDKDSLVKLSNFVGKPKACPHGKPINIR
ncbi:MAG: metal-dependent transcriptional regulator [Thermoplasmata archaeon]